jgi:UDP-glucose 4-epimerase
MRVLVTGGAGYIGSCATSILLDEGFEVTVLDDCSTGHAQSVDSRAKFIKASILDITAVRQALAGCDAVLHLAAKALVGESVAKPELYHQVNVGGSKNLLTEMAAAGVGKLVFSSTAATYGQPKTSPISEDAQTLPTNPYGQSKLEVDQMIAEAAKNGLAAISLRYFNVSGAHKTKSGWLAECHDPETHLIPIALKATPYAPLNIFGTDWPTPDGTCVRDYIHVVDLINAKVAALRNLRPGRHSVINLGSGVGFSVTEVISTAASVVGRDIPHVNSARRPGDPAILLADIKKAKTELDWSPTRSLRQMINDTWESQNDHG